MSTKNSAYAPLSRISLGSEFGRTAPERSGSGCKRQSRHPVHICNAGPRRQTSPRARSAPGAGNETAPRR
eukprot:6654471-Pyramimonas_sp.AAC.1